MDKLFRWFIGWVVLSFSCFLLPLPGWSQSSGPPAEPDGYRTEDYNKLVPQTLKGARGVVSADATKQLQDAGAVLIDVHPRAPKPANLPVTTVWREPAHRSIPGAVWLPNVGYGALSDQTRAYFETNLARLTGGDFNKPIVFFCLRDCWMSWNSAKRAISTGYTAVYWFSEGTDSWEESGYPLAITEPVP